MNTKTDREEREREREREIWARERREKGEEQRETRRARESKRRRRCHDTCRHDVPQLLALCPVVPVSSVPESSVPESMAQACWGNGADCFAYGKKVYLDDK